MLNFGSPSITSLPFFIYYFFFLILSLPTFLGENHEYLLYLIVGLPLINVSPPSLTDSVYVSCVVALLQEENHSFKDTEWLDFPLRIHYFEHNFIGQNFTIWGLTASILIRTARIVFGKEPDFLEFHPKVQSYDEILADFAKKDLFHL